MTIDNNVLTSNEISDALLFEPLTVFRGRAMIDSPGNSTVYAVPKHPGLNLSDFVKENWRDHDRRHARIGFRYHSISGETEIQNSDLPKILMVVDGQGTVQMNSSEEIKKGDIIVTRNNPIYIHHNIGHPIKLMELSFGYQSRKIHSRNDDQLGLDIANAMEKDYCTLFSQKAHSVKLDDRISYGLPEIGLGSMAKSFGIGNEEVKLGLNSVYIQGVIPEGEPLHHHLSNIVAVVVDGKGVLMEPDGKRTQARAGDILVVPHRAHHYFEAPGGHLHYGGIEFGSKIDYQKHMKD